MDSTLSLINGHPIFLKMYYFMFHFKSSLITLNVVFLALMILKTHVWLGGIQQLRRQDLTTL